MLTLLTGAPGAGKSAQLVAWILEAVAAGRRVYVSGIEDLAVTHDSLDDPLTWCEPGQVEDGALIVIDEVQRVWRPTASGAKILPSVAALETHRHRGLDFILTTQHPGLVHSNVRALIGRHVHLRNLGVLGRRWYEWPECGEPDRFRTAPIQRKYKLPAQVFSRYKSATIHVKPPKSIPPALIVAGLAGVLCLVGVWWVYRSISSKVSPGAVAPGAAASAASAGASGRPGPSGVPPGVIAAPGRAWVPRSSEPYDGLGVHLVGGVGDVLMFSVTAPHVGNRPVAYLSSAQMLRAGYTIRIDAPCSVTLSHGAQVRRVTCDQPAPAVPRAGGVAPTPGPSASAPAALAS